MKKLVLLSCIAAGLISTTTIAETVLGGIVDDTAKTAGAATGAAVGTAEGAVEGVAKGTGEGAQKCYDAAGLPVICSTVGATSGAVDGVLEGASEGALIGSGQE